MHELADRALNAAQLAGATYADARLVESRSQLVEVKNGIDQETAKQISKDIRDGGFKKVQVSIQGEELRVTSASRDTLQEVIAFVKSQDYGMELQFGNYR